MKFPTAIAFLCASVVAVSAETNGERMARGLPPKPPVRRGTRVAGARRNQPSGIHNSCNTGSLLCCNTVTTASNPFATVIIGLLHIVVNPATSVGLSCSPITTVGPNQGTCHNQVVCCQNNNYGGQIAIGCSPT